MSELRLRVFAGGGRATILDPGGSDRPTRFEVEWQNPSASDCRRLGHSGTPFVGTSIRGISTMPAQDTNRAILRLIR